MFLAAGKVLTPLGYVFVPEHSLLCFSAYQVNKWNRRGKIFWMNWCLQFKNFCLVHTQASSHGNPHFIPSAWFFAHHSFFWSPEVSSSFRLNMFCTSVRWPFSKNLGIPIHNLKIMFSWQSCLRWLISSENACRHTCQKNCQQSHSRQNHHSCNIKHYRRHSWCSCPATSLALKNSYAQHLLKGWAYAAIFELCDTASMVSGSWTLACHLIQGKPMYQ